MLLLSAGEPRLSATSVKHPLRRASMLVARAGAEPRYLPRLRLNDEGKPWNGESTRWTAV